VIGTAFVVVRGPALASKTSVSRALAGRLAPKSAVVSQDDLASRWIARHDEDFAAETELVYRQMRLLATAYVRGGYHVVVDAAFAAVRDGAAVTHEADLRDLLGLVATLPNVRPLLVAVTAPLGVLLERAAASERWAMPDVEALHRAFQTGAATTAVVLDTSRLSPDDCASRVLEHLGVRV
jgi:hypothetical protein